MAPEPVWVAPELTWTDSAVRDEVEGLVFTSVSQAVVAILLVLDRHGYDTIDRGLSFAVAADRLGVSYDDLYVAWLDNDQAQEHMLDRAEAIMLYPQS